MLHVVIIKPAMHAFLPRKKIIAHGAILLSVDVLILMICSTSFAILLQILKLEMKLIASIPVRMLPNPVYVSLVKELKFPNPEQ